MFQRELSYESVQEDKELARTLEREVKMARNIQMKLLNGKKPELDSGEVSGVSIPARLIGGDYFDFYVLPNGKLRIVIGDVMGKGIPAAMLMILTRGAFRSASESTQGPAETLTAMNKAIYQDLRTLGSFVTVLCADWDPNKSILTYSTAGHNLPLVVRSEEIVTIPETKGVMLGGLPETIYQEQRISLQNDDLAFFYTDGITEAANSNGEMYRIERLQDTLIANFSKDVHELEESVIQSLNEYTENTPQKDDITMVMLKIIHDSAKLTSYNSPVINS